MTMQSPRDLFLYELSTMYDFEHQNVRMMPRLAAGASDDRARQMIERHLEETQQQLQLLERCFEQLGVEPQRVTSQAAEGMRRDHEVFLLEEPASELLTAHVVVAAAKIEHLEVAAYRSLVLQADQLGVPEVVEALQTILEQEEDAAELLEEVGAELVADMAAQMPDGGAGRAAA